MPITQSRILRLLSAAEHYRDTSATLRDAFNSKCARIFNHTLTFEQAFAELTADLNVFTHSDPEHASTISTERLRYELTHRRNVVERRRMQIKRGTGYYATDTTDTNPPLPPHPHPSRLPPRTIAEAVAAVDATDEALSSLREEGLSNLGRSEGFTQVQEPTPLPDSAYFSPLDPATKALLDAEIAALTSASHKEPHK